VRFTFTCLIQSNVEGTVKKTINQFYNYSTVLGAVIRCKPYSEITVEIGTHLKTVKKTLNIFAVWDVPVTRLIRIVAQGKKKWRDC
jgi:hypothetical protein